jgi:tRNA pseudouridine38-40 synthase|uniref:tRNA pseudouridine synthase A n=1 Tax=Desulfobacca acetoxidans TaxID=60893 RepID=A0A7V6A5W4_9BACT
MGPRRNIRLTLEYDGTCYHGWQRQKNALSIQEVIETALARITGEAVRLTGSGRTDAGVHALGQVANFATCSTVPLRAFRHGLNSLLPLDIAVLEAEEVPLTFHARYSALSKTYAYRLLNRPVRSPINRLHAWLLTASLDVAAMQQAATALRGEHDFSAFRAAGSRPGTAVRRVDEAVWRTRPEGWLTFTISANGFLRGMVRSLVGTLVEIGKGKYPPEYLGEIMEKRDRRLAGPTAPPQGLFLVKVEY